MDYLFENSCIVCLIVQSVDMKIGFLLCRGVYKILWTSGRTNQIQLYEDYVSCTKGIHDKKNITNKNV